MVRNLFTGHWTFNKELFSAGEKQCCQNNSKIIRTCLASFPPKGTDNRFCIVQCSESNVE